MPISLTVKVYKTRSSAKSKRDLVMCDHKDYVNLVNNKIFEYIEMFIDGQLEFDEFKPYKSSVIRKDDKTLIMPLNFLKLIIEISDNIEYVIKMYIQRHGTPPNHIKLQRKKKNNENASTDDRLINGIG